MSKGIPHLPNGNDNVSIESLQQEVRSLKQQLQQLMNSGFHGGSPPESNSSPHAAHWFQIAYHSPMGMHMYQYLPNETDPERLVFIGANPAADTLLGVDNQQFIGKSIEDAFPLLAQTDIPEQYRNVAKTGTTWHTEHVNYNGTQIVGAFEVHAFQIAPNQMAAMFWNITQRKQTEEKLRENQHRLRRLTDIIDRSVDMVSTSTIDGTLQYLNPAGHRMLGLSEDSNISTLKISDAHPDWAFDILKNEGIPGAMSNGLWQGETAVKNTEGNTIPTYQTVMCHKDPDTGEAAYLSTIIRDISDSLRSQKEIQRLQRFMADILNSMPSVIIGVDEADRVTHWNLRVQELSGKTPQDVLGKPITEVSPNLTAQMDLIHKAMETRTPQTRRQIKVVYEREMRFIDVTVYPLSDSGVVVRVDDVTEKVHMEEMLVQTEKMQSVGGLAAGMAHEINNPLAAILQNLQVLCTRLEVDVPKNRSAAARFDITMEQMRQYMEERKIIEMLDRIRNAGLRASDLVSNMLSFSRQSSAGATPQNIPELMKKTIELVQNDYNLNHQYDFRKIQIAYDIDPSVPQVVCEPNKIQQVLLNLITNSTHAMVDKTFDEIEKATLKIGIRQINDGNSVEITITDNGVGMDEAVSRRIFEPFFTTKPVGKGTGLGLAICYFIITQQHSGQMTVESEPGKGTSFRIQLPAHPD
ncbi:MAG: PAS domain S-box protein [Deltaproteobacteria bacterium]|nr:PAS domain S-box protein [Deltaproteobacteria bacterium]MBN2671529.1 PAS domain S-box protein [Deltaproteobacteria bacterium]